ncbi:MAG: hypothetical protein AAGA77_25900 [Bacteroidota bacterium]
MNKYLIYILLSGFVFAQCKSDKTANYPSKDLLKHGFAISVKAPENAEIKSDDLGFMQELTISSGEEYNVQILKSVTNTTNIKDALNGQMRLVKGDLYFSKVIEEYDNGFIFEKKIDDNINYDFRYVKLVGENEYVYQTGMIGTFTEQSVRDMYKSVQ